MINGLHDEHTKENMQVHQEGQNDAPKQQETQQAEENLKNEDQVQAPEADQESEQGKEQTQTQTAGDSQDTRIKELENKFTRLSADFSNFKKRSEREKADIYQYANEDLIKVILPIIDDYDRAIDHYDEENFDAFGQGMNMIFKKLVEILKAKGVKEIEALGTDFDPNFHHAVEMSPNEHYESGKVCDVLMKGYTLNDKVIRPAMVRVSE